MVYIPSLSAATKSNQMARPSSLNIAKNDILKHFTDGSKRVYSEKGLVQVFIAKLHDWNLAKSTKASDFISFLNKHGNLKSHQFRSEHYQRNITRYSWGKASLYELALSIKQRSYLCHATAVTLHGLVK